MRRRPDRRADHDVDLDADPAHRALRARRHHRRTRVEDPRGRPRRGWWLRRQAGGDARRSGSRFAVARCIGKPIKYTETRSESLATGHHGRAQVQHITLAAEKDGTVTGAEGPAGRRPRLVRRAARRRHAGAGCVHVQRDLQVPGLPVQLPDRVHQPHLDRRLPRRRPARGDVRDRAGDGRPGRAPGGRPPGDPREELDQERRVPVHDASPACSTTPATTRSPRRRRRRRSGTTRSGPSRRNAAIAATASSSASGCRRSPRCAAWHPAGSSAQLSYGAGGWEHAEIRMLATGKVEVVVGVSPHGQGHETAFSQIVADRLGVPFDDVEVLHGDTQVSARGLDTYGSRSLVLGGEAVVMAADKVIEKAQDPRGAPARGQRRRRAVRERPVHRRRHRPGLGHRRGRAGDVHGAQLPGGLRAEPRLGGDVRRGDVLLPARHPPVRDRGRHRDRSGHAAQVHLRRRHRHGDQPVDRRGADARRGRAGHLPGAVGGGGARRSRARS